MVAMDAEARARLQQSLQADEWHQRIERKLDRIAWHTTKQSMDIDLIGHLLVSRATRPSRPSSSPGRPSPPMRATPSNPTAHMRRLFVLGRQFSGKILLYL